MIENICRALASAGENVEVRWPPAGAEEEEAAVREVERLLTERVAGEKRIGFRRESAGDSPAEDAERRRRFDAAQARAHERYGDAFRKLAE